MAVGTTMALFGAAAAAGGIGNIFSGITGGNAAKKAAQKQIEAANAAAAKVEGAVRDTNPFVVNTANEVADRDLASASAS